ncbi:hypothetical protein GOBAR_DD17652 [Gossypium barbadense]|nr:hypothetical protein GOBAR_DD17652 [Gossypium barbadense]
MLHCINDINVVTGDTVEDAGREISVGDRNTKKARFKGLDCDMENDMVVDSFSASEISWRDKVLGRRVPDSSREEDFKLLDGDVTRSTVLTQGHWIVFGQYLTVQPWTLEFDLLWAFPSNTMNYVRVRGLRKRWLWDLDRRQRTYQGQTRKLAVKGVTKIDLPGIYFQKGDFSSTKNHGGSFRDKKNNGAVVVNENTFSILGQNNMERLDFLDGAERREVSKPTREGSNKLFGSPIKSPSLDKKALENAGKIMGVGPGLTTQGGGGFS